MGSIGAAVICVHEHEYLHLSLGLHSASGTECHQQPDSVGSDACSLDPGSVFSWFEVAEHCRDFRFSGSDITLFRSVWDALLKVQLPVVVAEDLGFSIARSLSAFVRPVESCQLAVHWWDARKLCIRSTVLHI